MNKEMVEFKVNALSAELTGGLTQEEIMEELGGDVPVYPRIKIPAGGSVAFEIPGDDPNSPDVQKEVEGVVVWHHSVNAYWATDDNSNNPPDCSALDGKCGVGTPGGSCAKCSLNQFGSGEGGKGKACKNMKRLYILMADSLLPVALSLPPTSLRSWTDFVTARITKGEKVCDIATKITLTKKENANGNPYSVATFAKLANLDEVTKESSRHYREQIKAFTASGQDIANEYTSDTELSGTPNINDL